MSIRDLRSKVYGAFAIELARGRVLCSIVGFSNVLVKSGVIIVGLLKVWTMDVWLEGACNVFSFSRQAPPIGHVAIEIGLLDDRYQISSFLLFALKACQLSSCIQVILCKATDGSEFGASSFNYPLLADQFVWDGAMSGIVGNVGARSSVGNISIGESWVKIVLAIVKLAIAALPVAIVGRPGLSLDPRDRVWSPCVVRWIVRV